MDRKLFIGGEWVPSESGQTLEITSLVSGKSFGRVSLAGRDDAVKAVDAANLAFKGWRRTAPSEREAILLKAADILAHRRDDIVDILQNEAGSTFGKAMFEAGFIVDIVRCAAGECRRVSGTTYATDIPGAFSYSLRRPLGVVVGISPFNFPIVLGGKKMAFALAAGNCFILKPSEVTPLCGLLLGEIFQEAGAPAGVVSVLPGEGAELGDALIGHPAVKLVTFTGSTHVGKQIAQTCAAKLKKVTLELGGKNPFVILKDADLDYAVQASAFSAFIHQGQVCMAGSRIIVEKDLYDDFCARFTDKVKTLKVGSLAEKDTVIGPLIRSAQCGKIGELIDDALSRGAKVLTGGGWEDNMFEPTVIADVTPEMRIFHEECFGPIAVIIKADDAKQALALANNTEYGLSAAVFTNDVKLANFFSENIEAGMVHVNGPTVRDEAHIPFGGIKYSGLGREGGQYSIEEMTALKWVTVQNDKAHFPF